MGYGSGWLGGSWRWLLLVVAVLVVAALPAVALAASSSSRGLPDSSDPVVEAARKQAQGREAAQRAYWASPPAKAQRVASRGRYGDESDLGAVASDRAAFPAALTSPALSDVPLAKDQKVDRYLSNYEAQIAGPGSHRGALIGLLPLVTHAADGSRVPVDLRLKDADGGSAPRAPLSGASVVIPSSSGGAVSFPEQGFGVRVAGDASKAAQVSNNRAFYANTAQDTDVVVAPVEVGATVDYVLRSPNSPERRVLAFSLPAGASLRLTPSSLGDVHTDAAEIVDSSGRVLGRVLTPAAHDTQGQPVPVSYSVEGTDRLVVQVAHADKDLAYPLYVDPLIATWSGNIYGSWATSTDDPSNLFTGVNNGYAQWQGVAPHDYCTNCWNSSGSYYYNSIPGAYIYMVYLRRIYHYPNNSGESAGLNTNVWGYDSGSWQDDTSQGSGPGGASGTTTYREQTGEEHNVYTTLCAGQSNPALCTPSLNPPPAKFTVGANNGVNWGMVMKGPTCGYPCQYVPQVDLYGASIYESDDVFPNLATPSHTNLPSGWVQSLNDTVALNASVPNGLGLGTISLTGPGVSDTATVSCSSYPCPYNHSTSFAYGSGVPTGKNTYTARATSVVGNESNTQSWVAEVDKAHPIVTETGDVWTSPVLLPGRHTLQVSATDGVLGGPDSQQQSGVQSIRITVLGPQYPNGQVVQQKNQDWQACGGSQRDSCPLSTTYSPDTTNWAPGTYQISVDTFDSVGNLQSDIQSGVAVVRTP
jgi:hypothetical protein